MKKRYPIGIQNFDKLRGVNFDTTRHNILEWKVKE